MKLLLAVRPPPLVPLVASADGCRTNPAQRVADWPGGYRLFGWRSDAEYLREIDVLLHPAKAEPYGMVITEVITARVPTVISDACSAAAQVNAEAEEVVPLDAPMQQWLDAVARPLDRADAPPEFVRGWNAVARECVVIYDKINMEAA